MDGMHIETVKKEREEKKAQTSSPSPTLIMGIGKMGVLEAGRFLFEEKREYDLNKKRENPTNCHSLRFVGMDNDPTTFTELFLRYEFAKECPGKFFLLDESENSFENRGNNTHTLDNNEMNNEMRTGKISHTKENASKRSSSVSSESVINGYRKISPLLADEMRLQGKVIMFIGKEDKRYVPVLQTICSDFSAAGASVDKVIIRNKQRDRTEDTSAARFSEEGQFPI